MLKSMRLNIHVVFFVLFFFSVLSPPVEFKYINIFMVVVTLSAILLLSLKTLFEHRRYNEVLNEYRFEIILVVAYASVSLITMFNHRDIFAWEHGTTIYNQQGVFFNEWFNLLFHGLSPIALWCSMPLIWLVFKYCNHNESRHYWLFGWSVFIILALVGIWQSVDYQGAKAITQYFVAADKLTPDDGNISSLTRISTDFGVIMAFALICSIVSFNQQLAERNRLAFILMAGLFFIAGILSGSRNFLLTLAVGIVLIGHSHFRRNYLLLVALAAGALVTLIFASIFDDALAERFSLIFPFLKKLNSDVAIVWRDMLFIFQGNIQTSGRGVIWGRLMEVWPDHFWLGLSHKQFNYELAVMAHPSGIGSITTSAHNIILQSIVDGGFVGLVVMLTLIWRLFRRCDPGDQRVIFVVVLSSMMVDYYLDHSLPWMLCAAWFLNVYRFTPCVHSR